MASSSSSSSSTSTQYRPQNYASSSTSSSAAVAPTNVVSSSSTSGAANASSSSTTSGAAASEALAPTLWEWDSKTLSTWLNRAVLSSTQFVLTASLAAQQQQNQQQEGAEGGGGGNGVKPKSAQELPYSSPSHVAGILCKNILQCLSHLQLIMDDPDEEGEGKVKEEEEGVAVVKQEENGRKRKRRAAMIPPKFIQDVYRIWNVQLPDDQQSAEDIPTESATSSSIDPEKAARLLQERGWLVWDASTMEEPPAFEGGKLSQLSIGGLINAMAALPQGLVHKHHPIVHHHKQTHNNSQIQSQYHTPLPTAAQCTRMHLTDIATRLHRSIQAQVKQDILRTTPYRIQNMLAADLEQHEFASIRRRVYETVILGKGLHSGDDAAADDPAADLALSRSSAVHDIEKFKKCNTCGNNDQSSFVLDRKNGDVICSTCGTVVSESIMHEGSQYRKFEGEADRNHHGDAANPLYSNAHNMSTSLSGVQQSAGAGVGGWGSRPDAGGGKRNLETILRNAHAYTELNISQFGKTDRRTRTGYKDRQKKEAFIQMSHTGDALNLHEAVVQRAKELFAGFRDDRELVQQFKGVLAACLCEAFDQLSAQGKLLLKQQQQTEEQLAAERLKKQQADAAAAKAAGKPVVSARASRRNELHHATMAGKGGLLLDFSHVETTSSAPSSNAPAAAAASTEPELPIVEKPIKTWDLEDCRSWLFDASRRIAQQWVELRKTDPIEAKKLPTAPLEELEGQLVEHSITLCEYLESQMQLAVASAATRKKVITPRVNDMSKLGIKWQHSHERGSGGKGGIGGSGQKNRAAVPGSTRTAGQVLYLTPGPKFVAVLKDELAGKSIHKELRALIGQQDERKRKEMREEATRQRLQQMRRKPWVQARLQS